MQQRPAAPRDRAPPAVLYQDVSENPLLKLAFYLSLYLLGIFKIEFKVPTFRTYSGMDLAKILFENSLLCYL